MGAIYRKRCKQCASQRANVSFDGFVGCVIHDNEQGGEIITDRYLAYLRADNTLAALPHPLELSFLEAEGVTRSRAIRQGRLLCIANLICRDCGSPNTTASLVPPQGSCLFILGAVVVLALAVWLFDLPLMIEFAVFAALLGAVAIIDRFAEQRHTQRHAANVRPHQFQKCRHCGSTNAVSVSTAAWQRLSLPCIECNEKTVSISFAGKS